MTSKRKSALFWFLYLLLVFCFDLYTRQLALLAVVSLSILGALCNMAAVLMNKDKMPVFSRLVSVEPDSKNHAVGGPETRLTFLCDVITISIRFRNGTINTAAYSIGDLLILLAVVLFAIKISWSYVLFVFHLMLKFR